MMAVSIGGGMIEVLELDGFEVSIAGDYHELLVFQEGDGGDLAGRMGEVVDADFVLVHRGPSKDPAGERLLVQVKAHAFPDEERMEELRHLPGVSAVIPLSPVLPVQSRRDAKFPFSTAQELVQYNQDRGLALWELGVRYEAARGRLVEDVVFDRMREVVRIMRGSIDEGLAGTEYSDRILGPQAGAFEKEMEAGRLLDGGALNRMILYVTAVMEVKSSMGVIVAAPTAGSCGALPGACFGAADVMGFKEDDVVKAMFAAGIIGLFIAAHSTFAAESSGCQAETGAGAGMAAAALASLGGGTVDQALDAASMALQNTLGLICDPVANRVEVPCLGRNVAAAGNALASANMALAGFDAVIPIDEVIQTMNEVGASLPSSLRCTALGGLSVTPTSKRIEEALGGEASGNGSVRSLPILPDPGRV
jgi:L-serine dehydratase